jgi:hypothetical protein
MRSALSFKLALTLVLGLSMPATAFAQAAAPQSTTPPISSLPVPGELELAKMIWSIMAAVDHANLSGNYSVLRDLAAPGFQINNDAATLATIFSSIRSSRLDLSNTMLLAPTYSEAPRMLPDNILRLNGFFGLRPTAIQFTLEFQWVQGRWRLFGVAINPATMVQSVPVNSPQPAAQRRN